MKKAAVDIVRDYTGSEDGLQMLGMYNSVVIPSLCRLLAEKKVKCFLRYNSRVSFIFIKFYLCLDGG